MCDLRIPRGLLSGNVVDRRHPAQRDYYPSDEESEFAPREVQRESKRPREGARSSNYRGNDRDSPLRSRGSRTRDEEVRHEDNRRRRSDRDEYYDDCDQNHGVDDGHRRRQDPQPSSRPQRSLPQQKTLRGQRCL